MSQAFVEIVGKPNFETARIVLWLQAQQIEYSDIIEGSVQELIRLRFLLVLGNPI